MIKKWNEFNESYSQDEEMGKILLYFNEDSPTTWYYINDAIIDGLFIEKLDLNDEEVEAFGNSIDEEYLDMNDLADMIVYNDVSYNENSDKILELLSDWMIEEGLIEKHPIIRIVGEDEDGESYDISYSAV
jgi:hypothetical protein